MGVTKYRLHFCTKVFDFACLKQPMVQTCPGMMAAQRRASSAGLCGTRHTLLPKGNTSHASAAFPFSWNSARKHQQRGAFTNQALKLPVCAWGPCCGHPVPPQCLGPGSQGHGTLWCQPSLHLRSLHRARRHQEQGFKSKSRHCVGPETSQALVGSLCCHFPLNGCYFLIPFLAP